MRPGIRGGARPSSGCPAKGAWRLTPRRGRVSWVASSPENAGRIRFAGEAEMELSNRRHERARGKKCAPFRRRHLPIASIPASPNVALPMLGVATLLDA